ncbi:MAG: DUF1317 family protein [Gemmatimonadales bacterium]|nr:DUF1317 family protein [Gemmatimonadales bacterium]
MSCIVAAHVNQSGAIHSVIQSGRLYCRASAESVTRSGWVTPGVYPVS